MSQVEKLKARLAEVDLTDEQCVSLLDQAETAYLDLAFFPSERPTTIPESAYGWQIDAAVELYGTEGAEGQVSHSENGISRTWDGAWPSKTLRTRLTPKVGVL